MKHRILKDVGAGRLILLFAGWGMDNKPFEALSAPGGYDLAVVWDYRNLTLDMELASYREIYVIAWSYGVSMADIWLNQNRGLPVTRRVAVCGTLYPVDDERGIPANVFKATLDNFSETSIRKFYQRMVGGRKAFESFRSIIPERDIDGLREELECIVCYATAHPDKEITSWESVYVADKDYVIPTVNQLNGWHGHPCVSVVEGSHYPDFSALMKLPVCKEDVSRRFAASVTTYDDNATVQHYIASVLADIWRQYDWAGGNGDVIEIGAGTGIFTREYLRSVTPSALMLMDIAGLPDSLPGDKRICDAETEMMKLESNSADAVVTASTVQWFNSPARFLEECSRVVRPGGVVVMSTFGSENYREIGRFSGKSVNYISGEMLRKIMPSGLEIEFLKDEIITLDFESPRELTHHMRTTGVTGTGLADGARLAALRGMIREDIRRITYNPVYALLRVGDR